MNIGYPVTVEQIAILPRYTTKKPDRVIFKPIQRKYFQANCVNVCIATYLFKVYIYGFPEVGKM